MADLFDSLKKTWLKGMEAVGNTASNIAANTKQKVNEMNLENRRREILSDFGILAYEMWQKGEHFPMELERQLLELNSLDEELNQLKAKRYSTEAAKENENQEEQSAPESDDPCQSDAEPCAQAQEEAPGEDGQTPEDEQP